jgi:hypothetical protein
MADSRNDSLSNGVPATRIGRTFTDLCADTRKICGTCATTDVGLISHQYAVIEVGGQPDNWERLQEECILEGLTNPEFTIYR